MTDPLVPTLRFVADALRGAQRPWWVIGSAAVYLHGVDTSVSNVDLLLDEEDAASLFRHWRVRPVRSDDPIFRSAVYARHMVEGLLPVEVMANLTVRGVAVRPRSRIQAGDVFVPDRGELTDILRRFDRPKDLTRAALLETPPAAS